MAQYKCPKCDTTHEVTASETMRVVDGAVRRYDSSTGEPQDICPSCGSLSEYQRKPGPIQAPGLNFTDSGIGRKIIK